MTESRLYTELAEWWPLVSPPEDYAEDAAEFARVFRDVCDASPQTLLELGCGGGHTASHLKRDFELTLVDASPAMLDLSRALNPECEHLGGDMRTLRLGRTFDAVLIHDAIMHMTTAADLRAACETAHAHCCPGGAALFVPDCVRETFVAGTTCDGRDGGGRGLRFVEWTHDPEPGASTFVSDFAYLLRDRDGTVRTAQDRHVYGLFSRAEWLTILREVGFSARTVVLDFPSGAAEGFVGVKE